MFNFKNKQDYEEQRQELMNKVKVFLNEGKASEAEAEMKNVEAMDNAWKEKALELANLNALNDRFVGLNMAAKSVNVPGGVVVDSTNNVADDDMYASEDYRKAFMNNVLKGTPIPAQFQNADANTKTGDVGSIIPTTIMEKVIEKMEATGMILPLVTRTGYKGGLSVPTSSVKPVATWVSEGSGSEKQKKTTGSITFNYYKLRCAISMSLETSVVTLGIFETTFMKNVTEAMAKALETSIITGTGTGQPTGILTETPATGQALTIAKTASITYNDLVKMESALPLEYETNAIWCMTKKSFGAFLSMVDSAGQPIARVNYGINGRPERTLLGRTVVLNNYMDSYADTVAADTIFAFLFDFSDYILNTNYQMTVKQYEDNDTDDIVTKAILLADGKVVDKNSLVTLTKKSA